VNASATSPVNNTAALKDRNRWPLLATLIGNVAVFYVASMTNQLTLKGVPELIEAWRALVPAGLSFLFTSVANELLGTDTKARIVFWRWKDPLPGNRAFSHYAKIDPRIDLRRLKEKFGPLPTKPKDQNALWYRLYKSVEHQGAVLQVHRNYLFTRDYAATALLLSATLGIASFWTIASVRISLAYLGLLMLQYLLARLAARNHGVRFVTTVLAIAAAE
jgi:hypothetical protein